MEVLDEFIVKSGDSYHEKNLDDLVNGDYHFDMSKYFNQGLELFKQNIGEFIGFSILATLIIVFTSFIPFGGLLVTAPITVGYFTFAHKVFHQKSREFSCFFLGFKSKVYGHLLLVSLVSGIFTGIGVLFFILPGIYLAVAYQFGKLIVTFRGGRIEFWDAMEYSRKIISKKWWSILGFFFLVGLISGLGILLVGVGIFVTVPLGMCMVYAAYEDIIGTSPNEFDIN